MLLNEGVSDLKKDDLAIISEFQTLRNKLLHMTCDVMEEDLKGAPDAEGYPVFSTPSAVSGNTQTWSYSYTIGQCWYASVGIKYMFN